MNWMDKVVNDAPLIDVSVGVAACCFVVGIALSATGNGDLAYPSNWLSASVMAMFIVSLLICGYVLAIMILHWMINPIPLSKKLLWIMIVLTGYGMFLYYWVLYRGARSAFRSSRENGTSS